MPGLATPVRVSRWPTFCSVPARPLAARTRTRPRRRSSTRAGMRTSRSASAPDRGASCRGTSEPRVDPAAVVEPVVVHERDRGDAAPPHRLEQRQRSARPSPTSRRRRAADSSRWRSSARWLCRASAIFVRRLASSNWASRQPPAQLAVDVGAVGLGRSRTRVGREHPHLVAALAQMLDRGSPDQLVPAEVVRRVHVADRQRPARGRGYGSARWRTRSPSASSSPRTGGRCACAGC